MTKKNALSLNENFTSTNQNAVKMSDNELLDLVQRQTLKYFWDFGHPVSGMARERSTGAHHYDVENTVTTGGTGFGIMAMIAGAERGFLQRSEVQTRLHKICDFLAQSPTYRGTFPHFMDGRTGETIPFSKLDDGSDLVETSFLMMGLLTARQYFNDEALSQKINALWEAVEWDNHVHNNALMWHWSPNHDWTDNLAITGWHEAFITYVMAASSPTHGVARDVYEIGWTREGQYVNGNEHYGIKLPLGPEKGGPLFLSHYSFLGLDPKGLTDGRIDYFEQNRNHTLINRAHCIENPHGYKGYSTDCWGLTASDNHKGYSAHCPANDQGVISPTAALSAFPYTPKESMQALRHFYENLGDKIWGEFGFFDAFSETHDWVAESNLAIDQGPIVCMIENYRSNLLWNLFMSAPEIKLGLHKLGFKSPHLNAQMKLNAAQNDNTDISP
jgi:hypothetical protein